MDYSCRCVSPFQIGLSVSVCFGETWWKFFIDACYIVQEGCEGMNEQVVNSFKHEHILVCLSSSPSNERIVRTAGRMVEAFGCDFTALYVQTPARSVLEKDDLVRLEENTKLAEQLGAKTVTTHGDDVAVQIAEYARLSSVTKIVIGRSGAQRRHFWNRPTLTERLIELSPNLDIHIIPDTYTYRSNLRKSLDANHSMVPTMRDVLLTFCLLGIATVLGLVLSRLGLADANVIAIYLLSVLLASILTSGYACGVLASFLSVVLFNYFLTEPRLSLLAYGGGYPVTFAIMLASALLTGTLAAKLKAYAQLSARDAYRTRILFDTNQQLQKAVSCEDVHRMTASQLQRLMKRDVLIFPSQGDTLATGTFHPADGGLPRSIPDDERESDVVRWVWMNHANAGASTRFFPDSKYLYFAMSTQHRNYGVIGISIAGRPLDAFEASITLSILGECSMALENLHNAKEKEEAAVMARNEQLRANLLRSISHDLRTPLTSISGNADILLQSYDALDHESRKRIFKDMYDDSQWLMELVENLLSITRIENGTVRLNLSDQILEDLVSEALNHIDRRCTDHLIKTDFFGEPSLVRVDSRLIVQVVVNLVNNAIKYTPAGSTIRVTTGRYGDVSKVCVCDDGPGIPDGQKEHVFEMFYTGDSPIRDGRRSLGLGLALCKSIVDAHHGEMTLTDNDPHGCVFSFAIPLREVLLNE